MTDNEPPLILVKTWLALIKSSEEKEVKDHAVNMLLTSFGSLESVAIYCKKHDIKLN